MSSKRRIFVVGHSTHYASWMQGVLVKKMAKADLVVFTGGEDISPALYNEPVGDRTYYNLRRDLIEQQAFFEAKRLHKHMIGICRGAQLMCALTGGRLIQDQKNPGYLHPMFTVDGKELTITSMHHQAMFPYEMPANKYKVIAWAENHSPYHHNGEGKEICTTPFKEIEIAYFPTIKGLGIQGHPEMLMGSLRGSETLDYCRDLLNKHLKNEL